jgi:hypothetical protein
MGVLPKGELYMRTAATMEAPVVVPLAEIPLEVKIITGAQYDGNGLVPPAPDEQVRDSVAVPTYYRTEAEIAAGVARARERVAQRDVPAGRLGFTVR